MDEVEAASNASTASSIVFALLAASSASANSYPIDDVKDQ